MMRLFSIIILFCCTLGYSTGQVLILFPELYFDTEIDSSFYNRQWVGLFQNTKVSYFLHEIDIELIKAHHPMVDDENDKTGVQVFCNPNNPKIAFSNPENFNLGEVKHCQNYKTIIYPEDTTILKFDDKEYLFTATGKKEIYPSGEIDVSDYKLFITNDQGVVQKIDEAAFFDDHIFEIFWAGDLNGDNLLDLIIDVSYKYSFVEIVLFLSSTDNNNKVFHETGRHKKYYD